MEISYSKSAVKVINGMDRPTKQRIRAAIEKIPEGDIKSPCKAARAAIGSVWASGVSCFPIRRMI